MSRQAGDKYDPVVFILMFNISTSSHNFTLDIWI